MRLSLILKSLLLLAVLLPSGLIAQNEFNVEGVFRPRFEFRDGYKTLKKDDHIPAAFVSQRTRLSFDYKNPKIETRFTFFDYRVWGDQLWKKDIPSIGVHEAWAAVRLSDYSKLTVGRQPLQYDNGRLVSYVNWNQVGAAHDVVKFNFKKNNFELEAVTAWNQNSEKTVGTDYTFDGNANQLYYKNLNILWLSKKINNFQIASMTLIDGYEEIDLTDTVSPNNPDKLNYRYTTGLIVKHKKGNFDVAARGFYQIGKLYTGKEVSAYYLNLEAGYKLGKKSKLRLGCEVMSGNDQTDTANTVSNAFNILYGARHKFNGRIDYFSVPSTTKNSGLLNPYARYDYSLNKSIKLTAEYHMFFLQNKFVPTGEVDAMDKYLGHELDLTFNKIFNEYLGLMMGYSIMSGTNSLELLKGGDSSKLNHWGFVMLTVNPTMFTSKNE